MLIISWYVGILSPVNRTLWLIYNADRTPTTTCRPNPWLISALVKLSNQVIRSTTWNTICSPRERSVVLSFENMVVKTIPKHASDLISTNVLNKPPTPTVNLLKSVSGTITGGLWAIMGPSGSGKTTLLCALSLRLDLNRMTQSGEIRLNGKPYGTLLLKGLRHAKMICFMPTSLFRMCSGAQQLCQSGWWLRSNPVEHIMDVIAKR